MYEGLKKDYTNQTENELIDLYNEIKKLLGGEEKRLNEMWPYSDIGSCNHFFLLLYNEIEKLRQLLIYFSVVIQTFLPSAHGYNQAWNQINIFTINDDCFLNRIIFKPYTFFNSLIMPIRNK